MRRRVFHACALAGFGLMLAAGCNKADTILLVELYGPHPPILEPWQFRVVILPGIEAKMFTIPKEPHPSPLPQSFSMALDRSHTGPVRIDVTALDEGGLPVADGTTTMEHIVIGGETVIPVNLVPETGEPPPDNDGGADGGDAMGLDAATD